MDTDEQISQLVEEVGEGESYTVKCVLKGVVGLTIVQRRGGRSWE